MKKVLLATVVLVGFVSSVKVQAAANAFNSFGKIVFSQDFSTFPNGPVANYISATPNSTPNGQWNAITATSPKTVAISSGTMVFGSPNTTASTSSFSRTTDLAGPPTSLQYKFTINVSGIDSANNHDSAAVLQIGSGFSTGNARETTGVYETLNIDFRKTEWHLTDSHGSTSPNQALGTTIAVTVVFNHTADKFDYTAPNGTTEAVNPDTIDVWFGTTRVLDNDAVSGPGNSLTDLKFVFNAATPGTITFDNFELRTVPEPSNWMAGVGACALLVGSFRKRIFALLPRSK